MWSIFHTKIRMTLFCDSIEKFWSLFWDTFKSRIRLHVVLSLQLLRELLRELSPKVAPMWITNLKMKKYVNSPSPDLFLFQHNYLYKNTKYVKYCCCKIIIIKNHLVGEKFQIIRWIVNLFWPLSWSQNLSRSRVSSIS